MRSPGRALRAGLVCLVFVLGPPIASAGDVEFDFDKQLFSFWDQMPQMGTSGRVQLLDGTSSDCGTLALRRAKVSLGYAIGRRGAWKAIKTTVEFSPVGGRALDAASVVIDYLDSEGPEDFAKKLGKTVVSKAAGEGAGYAGEKGAGQLYDRITAKLRKGFSYNYPSDDCGRIYISAFVTRRDEGGGLEMNFVILGDCQCKVKDRFGQVQLGAWSVRGVMPLRHTVKKDGDDVTVTFSIPPGTVGDWFVIGQCPCKVPRRGDESAGVTPPAEKPKTRIPGFNKGFTAEDWICLNKCFGAWIRYRDRRFEAGQAEDTARKAEADAKSAQDAAAKGQAEVEKAKATLKHPPQGDPNLGDILRDASDTIQHQPELDERAGKLRKTADLARFSADLRKKTAEAALAELKDCLRTCIKYACANPRSKGFGNGRHNAQAPDWARAFQREILLPLLEEMRQAGQLQDCPRKKNGDVSYETGAEPVAYGAPAVPGGVAIRVVDSGQPVPGATVRLLNDGGTVAEATSDVTGAVRLPLEEGGYTVEVDKGGMPITSHVAVEGGVLDSYVVDDAVEAQSEPLATALPLLDLAVHGEFRASYRVENALVTVELDTPEGVIYLSAAELMALETRVTWGITLSPTGDTPGRKSKNRERLTDYGLSIGGVKVDLGDRDTARVEASTRTPVVLTRKRREVISGVVPTRIGAGDGSGPASDVVRVGQGLSFLGRFDGDASNTRVRIGGEDARIVAESTLAVSVYTSAATVGPVPVTIVEDGVEHQTSFRSVGLGMSIDKATLLRGESTTAHFEVTGLAGITTPVDLAVVNVTPGIISLAPRNAQVFSIAPGDVGDSGEFRLDRGVTGVTPGGFVISATVLAR